MKIPKKTVGELIEQLQQLINNGMPENAPVVAVQLTGHKETITPIVDVDYILKPNSTYYESAAIIIKEDI